MKCPAVVVLLLLASTFAGCRTGEQISSASSVPPRAAIPFSDRPLPLEPNPVSSSVQQVAAEVSVDRPSLANAAVMIQSVENAPAPLPGVASAELSLESLETQAQDTNPAIARAMANIQSLRGKWVQVGLRPNPTLGYLGSDIGEEGTGGRHGAYFAQRYVRGGKLELSRAVVAEEISKAEQELALIRQRVTTDARIGYYDVLIAQQKRELAEELVRVVDASVQASQKLLDAKEIPQIGLLQTQIEAERSRILLRRAANNEQAARQRLSAIVGDIPLNGARLSGSLDNAVKDLSWDSELQRLTTSSPEIAVAVTELERARAALRRATVQQIPDVSVQLSIQHDQVSDNVVSGLQIGLPLPIFDWNQGGMAQARGDIVAAERNIDRIERNLQHRLATAIQNYANARFEVEQFSGLIVPKAKMAYELVAEGYKLGQVGYLDMLTAQRTYFQNNIAYIDSLRDLWQATVRIDGLLLDQSLIDR